MSAGKRYVLDSNVFIQAHRTYYGFDICPGFWRALLREHEGKRVFSIDKVRDELLVSKDQLTEWIKNVAPTTLFKGTAAKAVSDAFRDMVNWVQNEAQFTAEAKTEFASVADGWVIAYAKVQNLTVVTHEEYAPDAKKNVPMPNICVEFQVDYCNTFDMLRDLKVRLGLIK
ncbi:MAG TPA: DUF4411 family protein [Gemmataceae bacterium]|nr:DUF4411 family protein [Gemmataceae bacterium]